MLTMRDYDEIRKMIREELAGAAPARGGHTAPKSESKAESCTRLDELAQQMADQYGQTVLIVPPASNIEGQRLSYYLLEESASDHEKTVASKRILPRTKSEIGQKSGE